MAKLYSMKKMNQNDLRCSKCYDWFCFDNWFCNHYSILFTWSTACYTILVSDLSKMAYWGCWGLKLFVSCVQDFDRIISDMTWKVECLFFEMWSFGFVIYYLSHFCSILLFRNHKTFSILSEMIALIFSQKICVVMEFSNFSANAIYMATSLVCYQC